MSENGPKQSERHPRTVRCLKCQRVVGEMQPLLDGIVLFKSDLSVLRRPCDAATDDLTIQWETYPVDMIISAQLLEQIERTGARRYILHRDDDNATSSGILVWIFNPYFRYSCSETNFSTDLHTGVGDGKDDWLAITAQRAMKLFYQFIPNIQALLNPKKGTPSSVSLEELPLPGHIYEEVECVLTKRNVLLPKSARQFKEWKASLFHVFEESDF
ncbi:predicted protein [Uncinocarpus reesii 1704]|uniref:Uncharacterized protein n=1 Tax=Uncinocarpus reesii (strain UAMH 1704) TaxID=336963 RepID=C4JHY2_UNCRE|nr:uncharacterized protein UREG_01407 [Uncinocarpus reesii 1704]EEP76558.1 predicted protein [Uncinocarpus reesii 1704]